ncbi:MAG: SMC family ATPase [Candidatus Thermoplasmatota archaeon]|nr:SMC family ATPase [Candidatus Thermoplasmatota archaeon]
MRINYLELKNYRRFRELKLQFPDGIVGILGLNGTGKTTVIEGIAWALFGNVDEVVRTSREGIRRSGARGNDPCSAILEFELGGTEYRIEREMVGKNLSMRAELRTKDKILAEGDKPVRKMVEKLIGMDHKSFFTSVFARQKELNALQNVAAGERKKVVLRMLRIDGVDKVLADVRSDLKDSLSRIEGAQKTLLAEDGREREKMLEERMPELTRTLQKASGDLALAEHREREASKNVDVARTNRDELKKDVDAYNSAFSDLKAKRSAIAEMRNREKSLDARIAEANTRLQRLPSAEKDEEAWKLTTTRKEAMEKEKSKVDKLRMIQQEIAADEAEETRRMDELAKLRASIDNESNLVAKKDEAEKARLECQTAKAEISGSMGELRSVTTERRDAAKRDRQKLEEIKGAGKDGTCPTCERRLDDAFELLLTKLSESSEAADKTALEAKARTAQLESELRMLVNKEEALKKKVANLDQQFNKMRQVEASARDKEGELAKVKDRLSTRRKSRTDLGEVKFSDQDYENIMREYKRLKEAHEVYLELKSLRTQSEHYAREIGDVRAAIKKVAGEEAQFRAMVEVLEPKKVLYEAILKEFDEKTATLNFAKDALRKLGSIKERADSGLAQARKEIDEIVRVKKTIEKDRKAAEELAVLEDVVVNFKDHLIGRVAPVLSELTSKGLESMTEGRYSSVELDENYEMQIDDQGTSYPINRFSGGESDLANLSLRLAISRIIADRTGATPINFLILDEIFGSQDPNRKRSVLTALSRLSTQFRQIFLITHIEDVRDTMNYVIRVEEQEDGTSKAELAS